MKKLIFIDFSINSTAIKSYDVLKKEYRYDLIFNRSHITKSESFDDYSHPTLKPFVGLPNVHIHIFDKKPMSRGKGDQNPFNRSQLLVCKNMSGNFRDILSLIIGDTKNTEIAFGIEDYAVGIKSNNVNQMSEITGACKSKMLDFCIVDNIHFYQPQILKGFATGNGNATKATMLNFYLGSAKGCVLFDPIKKNLSAFKINEKDIRKPVEDFVDAHFGLELLKSRLGFS
jgi:hypothetical protein